MRAAVAHAFDQPLSIEDVPVPTPGNEQVLDGSAPAPRLVFRMDGSAATRLGHDHRHATAHA